MDTIYSNNLTNVVSLALLAELSTFWMSTFCMRFFVIIKNYIKPYKYQRLRCQSKSRFC